MYDLVFVGATLGLAITAAIAGTVFPAIRNAAAAVSLLAAPLLLVICALCGSPDQPAVISLWPLSWLRVDDPLPVDVRLTLIALPGSMLILAFGLLALAANWISSARGMLGSRHAFGILLLQIAATFGSLAGDLVVVLMAWLVSDVAVAVLLTPFANPDRASHHESARPGGCLLPLRLSSVMLLLAIVLLNSRYHTTDVSAVMAAAAGDQRVDAAGTRSGLAICLAAAVAFRCGQFPGWLWSKRVIDLNSPLGHAGILAVLVPAITLAWRFQSWWYLSPDAAFLIAGLGGLTCVVGGLAAVARPNASAIIGASMLVVAGQALGAIGTGTSHGSAAAAFLASHALFALAWLHATSSSEAMPIRSRNGAGRRWVTLIGIGCLGSGCWGLQAVINEIAHAALRAADTRVLGFEPRVAYSAIWWSVIIGQVFLGWGLTYTQLDRSREEPADASCNKLVPVHGPDNLNFTSESVTPVLLVMMGLAAALGGILFHPSWWWPPFSHTADAVTIWMPGVAALPGAIGMLVAWAGLRAFSDAGLRLKQILRPIIEIGVTWCHAEEVARYAIVMPLHAGGLLVELIDRHILGAGRDDAWTSPAARFAAFMDSIRHAGPRYSLLAVLWAMIGLLIVLSLDAWTGR